MFVILIYTSYSKCRVVPLPVVADVQLTSVDMLCVYLLIVFQWTWFLRTSSHKNRER